LPIRNTSCCQPAGAACLSQLTITLKTLHMVLMIICICRQLNTSKVAQAIEAGARTPAEVHGHHGVTINCGRCCEMVDDMIRERGSACEGARESAFAVAAE
jgi:bacterioferritin-associated ferredoxin